MKAVFDSDVLIDYFEGVPEARVELAKYSEIKFSVVTWIEVLTGAHSDEEREAALKIFADWTMDDVGIKIGERAVLLRRKHKLRTPDAIIWATAQIENCLLVTRNTKDFPANDPGIRFPYKLKP